MKKDIIYQGNSRDILKTLPDDSIDCCVTSPPYLGLRDYGTAKWVGGSVECDHKGNPFAPKCNINKNTGGRDVKNKEDREFFKDICGKCGAKRIDKQLGLEKTPEEYVANMVDVFREVKRVLKKEGTLWLNLGDSYNRSGGSHKPEHANPGISNSAVRSGASGRNYGELKPKDLVGIPWRVAFALQADGWYLRQDIIWAKPNPMPESVTDRCTKSHEYIFLLSKSQKYYYDNEAIKEPMREDALGRMKRGSNHNGDRGFPSGPQNHIKKYFNKDEKEAEEKFNQGRNKRSVWTITTKPFKGAHFATFPEDLIAPMLLAGCPKGGIVLDPFFGAGTTGVVAKKQLKHFIGIELNPKYIQIAEKRIKEATRQGILL